MATRYRYFDPDKLRGLTNLGLLARQAVEGFITGLHRSPHKGFSVEFAEHREYVPGDDIRHMDWVAWGRSDRYYLKLYEQQTNLRAHILLDVSHSMDFAHEVPHSKFEYGAFLAASLAYLLVSQQDQVSLTAFDETVRFQSAMASTPAHLNQICHQLESLHPGGRTGLAQTLHDLAERSAKRGLIILISDLYDEPAEVMRALQHFVHHRHQVVVFHVLDRAELELPTGRASTFVDLETGRTVQADPRHVRRAYRQAMDEFVERYRRQCGQQDIEYVLATTETPWDRLLLRYLAQRKAHR
jgi:uncharacterized protein (DUF58 family)